MDNQNSTDNNKKALIFAVIGVLALVLLTIGATYAYFTFSSNNEFGSQTIEATTEAIGSGVTLTKVGEPLTLDVSALEMLEENIGTSYYATGSEEPAQIGKISVAGDGTFNCTYTMTVSATSTSEDKNLYTKFQNFEGKSEGQIYLDINDTRYDFDTSNLFPITYNGSVNGITSSQDSYITANMTIANTDIDQTVLNNADISLTFEVTQFDCELDTSKPVGETILSMTTAGLDTTTPYNGMYRYTGTTANNYVKLSDGTNEVLYRIIGIVSEANSTLGLEAGQIKLIKATNIGTYNWHTSDSSNITWENGAMYTYLQGTSVLGSTSVIPSGWSDKIDSVKWYIGDVNGTSTARVGTGDAVKSYEIQSITSSTSKIGLMYMSDYYYANTAGGTTNCLNVCSNWMTLGSNEWTMTRFGYHSGYADYRAWTVTSDGYFLHDDLVGTLSIRPVFYLTSDVQFVSGTGTSSDPFIVE